MRVVSLGRGLRALGWRYAGGELPVLLGVIPMSVLAGPVLCSACSLRRSRTSLPLLLCVGVSIPMLPVGSDDARECADHDGHLRRAAVACAARKHDLMYR